MPYLLDSDAVVEGDHCGRRDVDLGEEALASVRQLARPELNKEFFVGVTQERIRRDFLRRRQVE